MNNLPHISHRELETEIREALIRFESEFMGREPLATQAYLLDDMIIVRLDGVLIPTETYLAQSDDGRQLVKNVRSKLLEMGRPLLEASIRDIVGVEVQSLHTDLSTRTGERVIVFRLKEALSGAESRRSTRQSQELSATARVR